MAFGIFGAKKTSLKCKGDQVGNPEFKINYDGPVIRVPQSNKAIQNMECEINGRMSPKIWFGKRSIMRFLL